MTAARWLKELYDAHSSTLYRLAVNRLMNSIGNAADAQDVLQDVFRLALEKDISAHPNPFGWLIKATETTCTAYARKYKTNAKRHISTTVSADEGNNSIEIQIPVSSSEAESDVYMILDSSLTQEDCRIVQLYCIESRSIEEISATLGITPNALYVRIFRIRKRLKEIFPEFV